MDFSLIDRIIRYAILALLCYLFGSFLATVARADGVPTPEIKQAIILASTKYQVEPELIAAVIEVESKFNPNAVGTHGEIGLMQLHPRYHLASADVRANIDEGTKYLSWVRANCPFKRGNEWINCYNLGTGHYLSFPKEYPYYKNVMKAYEKNKHE